MAALTDGAFGEQQSTPMVDVHLKLLLYVREEESGNKRWQWYVSDVQRDETEFKRPLTEFFETHCIKELQKLESFYWVM